MPHALGAGRGDGDDGAGRGRDGLLSRRRWWRRGVFCASGARRGLQFAPGVSILKSLKGLDPGMMDAFRSHCRQNYAGEFELLFGVASLDDPAAAAVEQLQREFPERAIRLVECPERLGTNGKVSTLAQLAARALRFSAHQRFRHYGGAALPGAGDVLLCAGGAGCAG